MDASTFSFLRPPLILQAAYLSSACSMLLLSTDFWTCVLHKKDYFLGLHFNLKSGFYVFPMGCE